MRTSDRPVISWFLADRSELDNEEEKLIAEVAEKRWRIAEETPYGRCSQAFFLRDPPLSSAPSRQIFNPISPSFTVANDKTGLNSSERSMSGAMESETLLQVCTLLPDLVQHALGFHDGPGHGKPFAL